MAAGSLSLAVRGISEPFVLIEGNSSYIIYLMANLLSISDVDTLGSSREYLNYLGIDLRSHEIAGIKLLCEKLLELKQDAYIFNDFILGYKIPQISKEFDLLRLSDDLVINIELKREYNHDKILTQLARNSYYLKSLNRKHAHYTFVSETEKFYKLLESSSDIQLVDPKEVLEQLSRQKAYTPDDMDGLFKPSNYLVSPFNSTRKFIDKEYFLTGQQEDIKNNIIQTLSLNEPCIISVEGMPGTGKTLLLYDLARRVAKISTKKVLVVHVGQLNQGHEILKELAELDVISVRGVLGKLESINSEHYSCIIVDETQRIRQDQLETIIDVARKMQLGVIVGYDKAQTLSAAEIKSGSIELIESRRTVGYALTQKIRTNANVASFIGTLFYGNRSLTSVKKNVSIVYFSDLHKAQEYIQSRKEYQLLTYTSSRYSSHPIDSIDTADELTQNAHRVIGQEFDNVIAVIDNVFYYDEDGTLKSATRSGVPYNQLKMLFQIITRTRTKLEIVVVNNKDVFQKILQNINT